MKKLEIDCDLWPICGRMEYGLGGPPMERVAARYRFVKDDDGHTYLIPATEQAKCCGNIRCNKNSLPRKLRRLFVPLADGGSFALPPA